MTYTSYLFKGKLLLKAEDLVKELPIAENDDPCENRICNIISQEPRMGISETTLREMTYIAITTDEFPLLAFANEPLSHLSNAIVRSVKLVADIMEEQFTIPENIALAYENSSPFVTCVDDISTNSLSQPIPVLQLLPNDGDGLVQLRNQSRDPLSGAVFHRLYAIDTQKLYSTHFINITTVKGKKTSKEEMAILSHLAVHYYLRVFSSATIHEELHRMGQSQYKTYYRRISSFMR